MVFSPRSNTWANGGGRVERGVLRKDRRLQLAQLRARVETELFVQDVAALLVDPEGVGLASSLVERNHQQTTQSLA